MPWAIWSPEDFPKRGEQGYMVDYCQAYRIQILLKADTWTELEPEGFYKDNYVTSWVDKEADQKEITISAKELAARICRDKGVEFNGRHYSCGLMYCNTDKTTEKEMAELAAEGKKRNMEYRKKVVESFEIQFRVKSQGGPGRWAPNPYELECYTVLGQNPPDVVNRPTAQIAPQVQIIQPDPAMIAELVANEVAKQRAAETAARKI